MRLANQNISYVEDTDSITCGGIILNWHWYRNYWLPYWNDYYNCYSIPPYIIDEHKFRTAFNVAKLLLKKNLLASRKLKDFIGLMEEIATEL